MRTSSDGVWCQPQSIHAIARSALHGAFATVVDTKRILDAAHAGADLEERWS